MLRRPASLQADRRTETPGGGTNVSLLGRRSDKPRCHVAGLVVALLCAASLFEACAQTDTGCPRKLGGVLRECASGDTAAGAGAARYLTRTPDGRVVVEVQFDSSATCAAADFSSCGASVQFRSGARAQIAVPADELGSVAETPGLISLAPPARLIPCQTFTPGYGNAVSEAVQITYASSMQANGIDGTGCTVAVIDLGFAGVTNTEVNIDVADPTALMTFRSDGSTSANRHGTAIAEQVQDMAPGANLVLIAVDTPMSIESAINYVVAQGIPVAVMGLTLVDGPFDGTHSVTRAVEAACSAGVLWVQAAGNFALRHWNGTFTDVDGDLIHEFSPGVEGISLNLPAGVFEVDLSWYETAGSLTNRDYDLVLKDSTGYVVAQSIMGQNGSDAPKERLLAQVTTAGTYTLEIVRIPGHPTYPDKFQLFLPDYDISPATLQRPDSSLPVPAEAPNAFVVGAVRGTLADAGAYSLPNPGRDVVEPFSSRGPSLKGVLKPNLMGPDGCRTSLAAAPVMEGGEWIAQQAYGTSFAAAHVAGAAALLYSENNTRTRNELITALYRLAVAVPPASAKPQPLPNNTYGYGRVSLRMGTDVSNPQISITAPRNGDTITSTSPIVTAVLTDVGAGIDASTIVIKIDGVQVTGYTYDATTGVVRYVAGPPNQAPLSRTSHQVTVAVSDLAGNAADEATASFRVSPPTISSGIHMFSIPYSFAGLADAEKLPTAIFGLPSDQVTVARWLPTDTTPSNKYHYYGGPTGAQDAYASFVPQDTLESPYVVTAAPAGLGYFINLGSDATLNVVGTSLSDQTKYEIELSYGYTAPRGWNMIGCPFPDAVTWGGVQFVTNGVRQDLSDAIDAGVTEGMLFELKRVGSTVYYDFPSDPLAGTLEPWSGYWLHVLKSTTLVVYNSNVSTAQANVRTADAAKVATDGDWSLKLVASGAGGYDPANVIAVASGATDGFDAGKDVPKPPAVNSPVRVSLAHADWGDQSGSYARDVRGAVGTRQEWDVTVECTQPGSDVTLAWPELNRAVPASVNLILRDEAAGRDVYMRTVGAYTYNAGDECGSRSFKVIAEPAGDRTLLLSGVATAQAPDGTVQLSYTVSTTADVSVDILNISGRVVGQLGSRTASAGATNTVYWNGRTSQGTKAPSGRYMVRLTARTASGQVSQAVRALQITR